MNELPIACELSTTELAARRDSLLARLVGRSTKVEHLDSGLRLHFPGDAESGRLILAAIVAERRCCRFLAFDLAFAPDLGPIVLAISGPPGTRDFLESVLPLGDRGAPREDA
jgi:hypothetical protein